MGEYFRGADRLSTEKAIQNHWIESFHIVNTIITKVIQVQRLHIDSIWCCCTFEDAEQRKKLVEMQKKESKELVEDVVSLQKSILERISQGVLEIQKSSAFQAKNVPLFKVKDEHGKIKVKEEKTVETNEQRIDLQSDQNGGCVAIADANKPKDTRLAIDSAELSKDSNISVTKSLSAKMAKPEAEERYDDSSSYDSDSSYSDIDTMDTETHEDQNKVGIHSTTRNTLSVCLPLLSDLILTKPNANEKSPIDGNVGRNVQKDRSDSNSLTEKKIDEEPPKIPDQPSVAEPPPLHAGLHFSGGNVKPRSSITFNSTYCKYECLIKNIEMHTGEMPFKCALCEFTSTIKDKFKRHLQLHQTVGDAYKCSVCRFEFTCMTFLKRHLRKHTGKPMHKCPVCEFEFLNAAHLKRHMRLHTGEKPYQCTNCGEKFMRGEYLTRHVARTHPQEAYKRKDSRK